jgi:mono/diheme cytochrome c family protein
MVAFGAGTEGQELVGKTAVEWEGPEWIQGGPLTLEGLRGRVVLLRWWTGPDCPYCGSSAPYLNEWYSRYSRQGLVILGFYHHKSRGPLTRRHVAELAGRFGFHFPIAIDPEWRTLRRWWLGGHDRRFTSVSFLLDQQGIIRYVHPGGTYAPDDAAAIEAQIQKLLARTPPNARVQTQDKDQGGTLYEAHCASCHEREGIGMGSGPPLKDSPWVSGPESRLIKIVLQGLRGEIEVKGKTYNLEMPGFGRVLVDTEIASVLSFVRRSSGGPAEPILPARVRQVREATKNRAGYWTVDELLRDP